MVFAYDFLASFLGGAPARSSVCSAELLSAGVVAWSRACGDPTHIYPEINVCTHTMGPCMGHMCTTALLDLRWHTPAPSAEMKIK